MAEHPGGKCSDHGRARKSRFSVARWGAHSRRSAPAKRRYARSASRIASTNPSARRGAKPSSHQTLSTSTPARVPVDPRLDPADEAVAEDDREHVIAPTALRRREEALPHVLEVEQAREEGGVPQQRVERGDERDGGGSAPAAPAAARAPRRGRGACRARPRPRRARARRARPAPCAASLRSGGFGDAGERAAGAAGAEQAVGAVPGQELVPELFSLRHLVREHLGREQPFEEVVVPEVAVAPREADHARDGVRLEHGAHGVLRHPEPVLRRAGLALEVARGQRPVRPDPLEHALGHRGVVGEGRGVEPRPLAAHGMTEPGELARRDERQRLVGRLEDLAAFVEQRRTRRARSRRRARAARGRGSGRRPRSGRTGSTRASERPRAPRRGLPRATARARGSAARRESDAPPRHVTFTRRTLTARALTGSRSTPRRSGCSREHSRNRASGDRRPLRRDLQPAVADRTARLPQPDRDARLPTRRRPADA